MAALHNAFRIPVEHLEAGPLFATELAERVGAEEVALVSPDAGGMKRAEALRAQLEHRLGRPVGRALMEKHRQGGEVHGDLLAGDVAGRTAIVVDDLISSGATLARATRACHEHGATRVLAVATHALFTADAGETLASAALAALLVTDSVPPDRVPPGQLPLRVVPIATLLAAAIRELHLGGSITALREGAGGLGR